VARRPAGCREEIVAARLQVAALEALDEPVGQAEVEQRVRAGVEPVVREPEGSTDVDDGVAEWLGRRADRRDIVRRPRA
jgi:hypothetical protein